VFCSCSVHDFAEVMSSASIFHVILCSSVSFKHQLRVVGLHVERICDCIWVQILKEECLLAVASWPNLHELVIYDNPLTISVCSELPALTQFLQQRHGIQVHRCVHSCSFSCPLCLIYRFGCPVPKLYWSTTRWSDGLYHFSWLLDGCCDFT